MRQIVSGDLVHHTANVLATLLSVHAAAVPLVGTQASHQLDVDLPKRSEAAEKMGGRGTCEQRPGLLVVPRIRRIILREDQPPSEPINDIDVEKMPDDLPSVPLAEAKWNEPRLVRESAAATTNLVGRLCIHLNSVSVPKSG